MQFWKTKVLQKTLRFVQCTEALISQAPHTLVSAEKKMKQVMLILFFIVGYSLHCIRLFALAMCKDQIHAVRGKSWSFWTMSWISFASSKRMSHIDSMLWSHILSSIPNPCMILPDWSISLIFYLDHHAVSFLIYLRVQVDILVELVLNAMMLP